MNRNKKAREEIRKKIEQNQKSEEQIAYERKITKERNSIMIKNIQREIEFKQEQLISGIKETRTINRIPDGTAVTVDGYIDNKKPKFMIENEIDALNQRKKEFEQQIKDIEEIENDNTKNEGEASNT